MNYLIFNLAGQEFGIPVDQVREALRVSAIQPLPEAPAFVEGFITLRGHSVAVVNLRKKFKLCSGYADEGRQIVLVEVNRNLVGILVDQANEVLDIAPKKIDDLNSLAFPGLENRMVKGIAHAHDREILLLSLEDIFKAEDSKVWEGVPS